MRDDPTPLLDGAREESRHVDEGQDRQAESAAELDESGGLHRRLRVEDATAGPRLVGDDADGSPVEPAEHREDARRVGGHELEPLTGVEHAVENPVHVEHDAGLLGHDERQRVDGGLVGCDRSDERHRCAGVGRQERQQATGLRERSSLVVDLEMGDARRHGVELRPADLVGGGVLARGGLHDVGAGQEHVPVALDHDGPVGQGRRVGGSAGARAEDHRDLRHAALSQDVQREDPAAAVEGEDAVRHTGTAGVVQVDDREASVDRDLLRLLDGVGEHGPDGTRGDRGIVGDDHDVAAVDPPPSRQDAGSLAVGRAQRADLDEGTGVDEHLDPFPGGVLTGAAGLDTSHPVAAALRERRAVGGCVECCEVELSHHASKT